MDAYQPLSVIFMWSYLGLYAIWPLIMWGGFFLFMILNSTLSFVLSLYVYVDGKKREVGGAEFWMLLVLFTGVVGFLVYYLTRPKELKEGVDQKDGLAWLLYYFPLYATCWLIFWSCFVLGIVLLVMLFSGGSIAWGWWAVPFVKILVLFPICFFAWIKSWDSVLKSPEDREEERFLRKKSFVLSQLVSLVTVFLLYLVLVGIFLLLIFLSGGYYGSGSYYQIILVLLWLPFLVFVWTAFYLLELLQLSRVEKKLP